MKPNKPRRVNPSERQDDGSPPPVPGGVLTLFLAVLAAALVLGYLFLNKMVDISRQEDCVLAHRKNCAVIRPAILTP
jgi:hypothetical protein